MMLHLISRGCFVTLLIHGWQLLGRLRGNIGLSGSKNPLNEKGIALPLAIF
jgi:hypothetical protein